MRGAFMAAVGVVLGENASDIVRAFQIRLRRELGREHSALEHFAPIFLSDLARAFQKDRSDANPWRRAILLISVKPEGGMAGLTREFAILRHALWETLTCRRHAIASRDRRLIDRALDEALAEAIEQNGHWSSPQARTPQIAPFAGHHLSRESSSNQIQRPPPLPTSARARTSPPPLPTQKYHSPL